MSDQALLLAALLLPFAGALGIVLCGRWPNLREAVTLVTAGALSLLVINLYLRLQAGATIALQLAEPLPGLALRLEIEPLGMLFALVAGVLWLITSVYAIGYMRGHHEQNQTRFYALFAIAIGSTMGVAFAGNLFTLFLWYEVLTISTYPLVAHAPRSACSCWPS
jgi:multicomponent Na+:H+ antiporter subunit D